MEWIVASLVSAVFLGCYELSTKHAVRSNAVLPVLFLSNVCSLSVWAILLGLQWIKPTMLPSCLIVAPLTWMQHLQLALKSIIVALSWVCTYFAMKHLPVSIASPIRATSPVLTLVGALLILAERPTAMEIAGILTTIGSFFGLSLAGRSEGIHFHRDKWIGFLAMGTILGACSGLYDKFLLGKAGFSVATVQAWFVIYLTIFFTPLAVGWKLKWWPRNEFHWRWSIPLLAMSLLVADFIYFGALKHPDALVSLVSSLRRGSTLVAFIGGIYIFKEENNAKKTWAVSGVLIGIVLTVMG